MGDSVDLWRENAASREWQEISWESPELSKNNEAAVGTIAALNHLMFGHFAQSRRYSLDQIPMLGGQIMKKNVAGRDLYLSIFGAASGSKSVGECRIHDLMGDGYVNNPIKTSGIAKIASGRVKGNDGPFDSRRYTWPRERGKISQVDVHFGFDGWPISPFSEKVKNFSPYAPYGLTLVAGFHEQVILAY